MPRGKIPIEIRFWDKVKKQNEDDCWEWAGYRSGGDKYGYLSLGGRGEGVISAHRFCYQLHNEEIPESQYVLHRCDNAGCVNPKHLYLGSQKQNMCDMVLRERRTVFGPPAGRRHKLSKEQEKDIRDRWSNGESYAALAREFKVGPSTISRVVRGINGFGNW